METNPKYILFLSSNTIMAGSEVLWMESAKRLSAEKFLVKAAVYYDYEILRNSLAESNYIDLRAARRHPTILQRIYRRLFQANAKTVNRLKTVLADRKPDLVVISQGNNKDGAGFMRECIAFSIPFVTITHLVTEELWPGLNDEMINDLSNLYQKALRNYFVSRNTLAMNEKLLGRSFTNSAVLFNPFTKNISAEMPYPNVEGGLYKVALIGRVEIYHKGYDLLVEVLKQDKWRTRPIHFSLFGEGPHGEVLERLINESHISNFNLYGYQDDISKVWADHHLLMMPSRMEGQSLTLIEAMRFSRATVATNVGGTSELIEEGINGFMAKYPTMEHIDAALERAWERREDWEQLGLNAYESINQKHPADAVGSFNRQLLELIP